MIISYGKIHALLLFINSTKNYNFPNLYKEQKEAYARHKNPQVS